jgi:hypothetical protein
MHKKRRFYFFCLTGLLVAFLLSSIQSPVYGESSTKAVWKNSVANQPLSVISRLDDNFDCLALIREVAISAGLKGQEISATDYTDIDQNYINCNIELEEEIDNGPGGDISHYYNAALGIFSITEDPESMVGADPIVRTEMTFHGFPALLESPVPFEKNTNYFHWYVPDHQLVFDIYAISFDVVEDEITFNTPDVMQIAEIFYAITYNQYPELLLPPPDQGDSLPLETEQVIIEEQPEVVIVPYGGDGEETPLEEVAEAGSFDETWDSEQAKAIRSPLIPIGGGLLGIGLAWLLNNGAKYAMNAASSVNQAYTSFVQSSPESTATPPTLATAPPELLTSPPQLQTSPPEILSAEAQQTKEMLEKGYIWTDSGGWQTKSEIEQFAQANQNNASVSANEDAIQREKWEAQQRALKENDVKLKENAEKLKIEGNRIEVSLKLNEIDRSLREKSIYVYNPNQGVPLWDTATQAKNWAWDKVFKTRGLTCEGYVDETIDQVKEVVQEKFGQKLGDDLKVEGYIFDEKSSIADTSDWWSAKDWKNWMDQGIDDNHNLIKVTLPDGSEWAVDFHQHNTGKRPALFRPWKEAVSDWKPYIGENEFRESLVRG